MHTIVIADDEPSLRLLVSATVSSDQFQVIEAVDGDDAWQMVRSCHPDVALLDVQMPGKTGLELARAIKDDLSLSATRVVLLSAKAQQADIQAGLDAGADHYLTKPFSPFELMALLTELVQQSPVGTR